MTTKIKLSTNVADVDVTTTAPTNGQGLIYNSTSSKWVPGAAGGGVTTYDTIDDLPLSGVDEGALALVKSTDKLYLWMNTGWYNIATINTNPSITGGNETPYILANDGTPTVITLVASDPEGIPLTWSYEVTSGSLTNGGGTTATVSNVDNVFTVTPTTTEDYAGAFSLTFKASDGVNIGTSVAAFTLAFRVVNSHYTTLLAKGTAATQNATFVDSSTNAHTVTANGDVYQGTFSPYRSGGYSMYFDGTGDYIDTASTTTLSLDGAFTIEFWLNPAAITSTHGAFATTSGSFSAGSVAAIINHATATNKLSFWVNNINSVGYILVSNTLTVGAWHHIAIVRDASNNMAMFVNGTRTSTATASQTVGLNTTRIGQYWNGGLNGNLSNFRTVKGSAVYDPTQTTLTVPKNPLTAITNTSLLINTPYIADSSTNAHAITVNGNTSTQPFGPFDYKAYDAATNGGSAYFDGSGDYLTVPYSTSAFDWWVGDYTIEAWVYPTAFTGWSYTDSAYIKPTLIGNNTYNATTNYWAFGLNTGGNVYFAYWNGTAVGGGTSSAATLNSWNHIALVISSGTITLYLNGTGTSLGAISGTPQSSSTTALTIGAGNNTYINGYVSNLRIVKGTAVYTTDFTPPTTPLTAITNTSLLLNFTNAGIQDYSQVSDLKLLGNATGSSTQTKYASYSMYMPAGDTNYALIPANTQNTLGTVPFTIEFWMLIPTGYSGDPYGRVIEQGAYNSVNTWRINRNNTTNNMIFQIGNPTTRPEIITSTVMSNDTWYHVAVVRGTNNTITMYINGTSEGTPLTNRTDSFISSDILLGMGGTNHLECYIEDLRITKGLARYGEANFTPPTSELLG